MENKEQKTAEEKLRVIAESQGMTLREFHQLFNLVFIDDEKIRNRVIAQQQQELQFLQNQLHSLQFRNESMNNQLLTYELEKKVKEMELEKAEALKQPTKPKKPWSLFKKASA